jgi:hypothetical protein
MEFFKIDIQKNIKIFIFIVLILLFIILLFTIYEPKIEPENVLHNYLQI